MRSRIVVLIVATSCLASCNTRWQRVPDNSYYAQNRGWVDESGRPVASGASASPMAVPAAPQPMASPSASVPGTETPLEELQTVKRALTSEENVRFASEEKLRSLTLVLENLRQDNARIQSTNQTLLQQRDSIQNNLLLRDTEVAELENRLRQLADELLTERIVRLRVERDLVATKVQTFEGMDKDG